MFLEPVKIDTPVIEHESLGNCYLVQKFSNGNAIVQQHGATYEGDFYIIDLRDTNYLP